jgi:V-type H+-transporting ATPase subunit E
MEAEVVVRVRKSDEAIVQSIIEPAVEEYKAIMKKEVKAFKNKDVPCKVTIDKARYLPEYDENEATESCMGGIVLHCRKGRIVCSNTLDERLSLCYQEAIPDVRRLLFPSFKVNKVPKAKPIEATKIKHAA